MSRFIDLHTKVAGLFINNFQIIPVYDVIFIAHTFNQIAQRQFYCVQIDALLLSFLQIAMDICYLYVLICILMA